MTSTTAVTIAAKTTTMTGMAIQPPEEDSLSSLVTCYSLGEVTLDDSGSLGFVVPPLLDPLSLLFDDDPLSVSSSFVESCRPSIVFSLSSLSTILLNSHVLSMMFFL